MNLTPLFCLGFTHTYCCAFCLENPVSIQYKYSLQHTYQCHLYLDNGTKATANTQISHPSPIVVKPPTKAVDPTMLAYLLQYYKLASTYGTMRLLLHRASVVLFRTPNVEIELTSPLSSAWVGGPFVAHLIPSFIAHSTSNALW